MKIKKVISKRVCISVIIILNCLVYSFCFLYDYLQDGDEFSSIAFPVYLAGGDWSDIIANTTIWHGFGHVLIFAPIFKFCKTWTAMYNVCRIGCLIGWIFLSVLIFYIASKYFELSNERCLLISLVCTLGNIKPDYGIGLSVETELPIGIITVISMLLLFKVNDSFGSKKRIYSFLLLMLAFYSFSIHSRAMVLILTIFAVVIVEFVVRRKKIISFFWGIIGAGSGFTIYKFLNNCFVENVLTSGETQSSMINNISQISSSGLQRFSAILSSGKNVVTMFEIFFSLFSGFVILSFGALSLFIVADVQYIFLNCRRKELDNLGIGVLVGLFSFFLMNGLIAIRQYANVLNKDRRWLIYLRYAMPFVVIIVFTGLVVILKKKCDLKRTLLVTTIINICILFYFANYPLQDLKNTSVMKALANIFRQFFYRGEKVDEYFFKMIKLVIFLCFLAYYLLRKNKQFIVWTGYIMISILFLFSSLCWHYNRSQEVDTYTNASEEFIRSLERENDELGKIKIYCNATGLSFSRYLGTNCPWSEIDYVSSEDFQFIDLSDSIVLSDDDSLNMEIQNIYKIELDKNEFLYTTSTDIYNWYSSNLIHE